MVVLEEWGDEPNRVEGYAEQLEYVVQLITALEFIEAIILHYVPVYPDFRKALSFVLDGVFINCTECGNTLAKKDGSPISGIRDMIANLYEVQELLELEVIYEESDDDEEG